MVVPLGLVDQAIGKGLPQTLKSNSLGAKIPTSLGKLHQTPTQKRMMFGKPIVRDLCIGK